MDSENKDPPPPPAGKRLATGALVVLAVVGAFMVWGIATVIHAVQETNILESAIFAMNATYPLQQKVEAFYQRERRLPTSADLGAAESNPHDHGDYRLQPDGSILIAFSEASELKDRRIVLRPQPVGNGTLLWECAPNPGWVRNRLPASCR
jgi:hypothetical protein